ncbi:hypothetical protein ACSQ67_002991 [Phaseolus vulgaris]
MGSYGGSSEGSVNKLLQQIGCLVMADGAVVELSLFVGYGWSRFMAFLQLLREFDTLIRYMVTYTGCLVMLQNREVAFDLMLGGTVVMTMFSSKERGSGWFGLVVDHEK